MKFSIQSIIWAFVLIALLVVAALSFVPQAIEVETAVATQGDLLITVQEDGKTRIAEKYIVSAPVAGRLARIELEVGDQINDDGRLVAVIVPADPVMLDARSKAQAEARLEQANAAIKRAAAAADQIRVNFELSQKKYERMKRLLKSNSISRDEYDVARAQHLVDSQSIRTTKFDEEIAMFEQQMAQAALLQYDSDDRENSGKSFEIFAPVGGKVLRVFQESSTVVSVGTPLVEIGDPSNLEIEIDVLSTDAVRIKPGSELAVEHWGGESQLKGSVRVIEPAAFTKVSSLGVEEQRVNIIAEFDEPAERIERLGDGYRVEARITIEQINNALLIPNSALFRHQGDWHVFAIVDGVAQMQKIEIGRQNETHTQVTGGLKPNDDVILYPSDRVANGTKIKPAK